MDKEAIAGHTAGFDFVRWKLCWVLVASLPRRNSGAISRAKALQVQSLMAKNTTLCECFE